MPSTYAQKQASKRYTAKLHRYQLQFTEQDEDLYRYFASVKGSKNIYLKALIRADMERGVVEKDGTAIINANTKKAIRRAYEGGGCVYEDANGAVYAINEGGLVKLVAYRSGQMLDELMPEDVKHLGSCKDW